MQAIVDCLGRFLFIAVAAPGSQPDINAFSRTSLHEVLSDLPVDYFIIGDNAYKPTEYMVPVFGGGDRRNVYNANCNLYLSQEYIPVEMAFGMTVNLFGILKAPLRLGVRNVSPI